MTNGKTVEDVRNYWNDRPCNIRHSNKDIGTKEYFDEVEKRKYFVEPHIPGFAEFDKWEGKKVMEVGCGLGTDTISFLRAGARVTAVDLSKESVKMAEKRAHVFGLHDQVDFYVANAEKLDEIVPVKQYDLVYSFGVIHHTPHPEVVVEKIKKYLPKGGTFKIMVYYKFSWKVLWIIMRYGKFQFWKIKELVPKYSEAQVGSPVTYYYSRKEVKKLLEGFEIKDIFVDHIFPFSIPEYKKYEYKKVWYFRFMPKSLFRLLERSFGWHLCVTAIKK
ncbi:class I SAM-dependent methyltransferase [Candidatus Parcubacteria bacterium]|jgi:ubiquinone/menaquinone biosynthesis C-methylase UbiE|nr:class I SAM-dependent methyltransferase [Candidatus Parcubacteria bacterium]MBT3948960.1 class I SAM-dependent methyltransferase [Candidatus Parcubacteria bacterium]